MTAVAFFCSSFAHMVAVLGLSTPLFGCHLHRLTLVLASHWPRSWAKAIEDALSPLFLILAHAL